MATDLARYLDLIEQERECRPAEAMLADEIKRLVGQVAKLKARNHRLTYQKDWAESEARIATEWGDKAWDQIRHLRDLLEKAIAAYPQPSDGVTDLPLVGAPG